MPSTSTLFQLVEQLQPPFGPPTENDASPKFTFNASQLTQLRILSPECPMPLVMTK